jgi:hypothetical protein
MADLKARMQATCSFWEKFDLDGRRLALDQQSLEMADAQENGVSVG